jgi:heme-degrading monooxygenase HmoA
MHIQIINFHLKGVSERDYAKLCEELAPAFAGVPGLLGKVWLANPETNTYGGVYTWRDRQAMEDFTKTELFRGVATHPALADITSTDFAVMEGPTRVTRGWLGVAA